MPAPRPGLAAIPAAHPARRETPGASGNLPGRPEGPCDPPPAAPHPRTPSFHTSWPAAPRLAVRCSGSSVWRRWRSTRRLSCSLRRRRSAKRRSIGNRCRPRTSSRCWSSPIPGRPPADAQPDADAGPNAAPHPPGRPCRRRVITPPATRPGTTMVPGWYAAAGPSLRRAIGPGWRNWIITVCSGTRCVDGVRLSHRCACGSGHARPTVLDLSLGTFSRIAPAVEAWPRLLCPGADGPRLRLLHAALQPRRLRLPSGMPLCP